MTSKQSSFFRIDEQVVYTMITVCIISVIVLAFRYTSDKTCDGITLSYGNDSIFVNDIVHFNTGVNAESSYKWIFGDGTQLEKGTSSENHKYKEARTYTVSIHEGNCVDIRDLVVYEHKSIKSEVVLAKPVVNSQSSAFTGEKVRFFDSSPSSTSWEWYFEDNPEVYGREREVWYTFKKPGSQKVFLKVNKNAGTTFTDYITINNKPDEFVTRVNPPPNNNKQPDIVIQDIPIGPPLGQGNKDSVKIVPSVTPPKEPIPEVKKAPEFNDSQWSDALYKVSDNKKNAQDFNEYLCGKQDVKVIYNNKIYTFSEFCDELKSIKARRIKTITVITVKNLNNCVVSMQVAIKRKLIDW